MADNTAPSADPSVATDDIAGVHHQRVKLVDGTLDGTGAIPGDATRGLAVEPRSKMLAQSQASSGLTTASTSYAANDVLGAGWEFTNMARAAGGGGRVLGAVLLDKGDVITSVDLVLSSGSISFGPDNGAPAVSDTDGEKLQGTITVVALDYGGCRVADIGEIGKPYVCDATSLFVYARTAAAHSFFTAATDLRLKLFYVLD